MRVLDVDVSRYNYQLPDLNPPVIIRQCFSADFCDHVCEVAASAVTGASGVHDLQRKNGTEQQVETRFRSSSYCKMPADTHKLVAEAKLRVCRSIVHESIDRYGKFELAEGIGFLKYDGVNRGHFSAHTDNAYWGPEGEFIFTYPKRIFTSLLYLNEGYEGGELILNTVVDDQNQPITIIPKRGMLVLFPADLRFIHEVKPMISGTRYSVVGWYNAT